MRIPSLAVAVGLLVTTGLLAAMMPAAAQPGDVLLGAWFYPCGISDPWGVEVDAEGGVAVSSGSRVRFVNPDRTCGGVETLPYRVVGLAHDGDHDHYWLTHGPSFPGATAVYTWEPGAPMQFRFTLAQVGGRAVTLHDLAYDPVRDTLWIVAEVTSPSWDAFLVETTLDGQVLRVWDPSTRVVGAAHDGVTLWVARRPEVPSAGLVEGFAVPAPGAPWPAPHVTLTMAIDFGLAFDPRFPRGEGTVCAFWTVRPAWPNYLAAYEAPCPAKVVADAWSLRGSGPPGWVLHERARAYAEQGDAQERVGVSTVVPLVLHAAGGESLASTALDQLSRPIVARATALSTLQGFDVAGLVQADAVVAEARASIEAGGPASSVSARIMGLRIAGGQAIDVPYDGIPRVLELPDGLGTVRLFQVEQSGVPGRSAEARITAITVDLATPAGPVHLEAGMAWAGAAFGASLRDHPPMAEGALSCDYAVPGPVEDLEPGLADGLPCPDASADLGADDLPPLYAAGGAHALDAFSTGLQMALGRSR